MDNTTELKVKSFRADDETFEKFKALATEEFGNQAQCLTALINLYETEKSKLVLGDRKVEVETFQTHLNRIGELFLASMQLNQDAEVRVRGEFERLLISKDKTISDLQGKVAELAVAKQTQEEAMKAARLGFNEMFGKNTELENQVTRQDKEYTAALAGKDSLNKALADSCAERKSEIDGLRAALAKMNARLMSVGQIEDALSATMREKERLTTELERQRSQAEMDRERALLTADKAHQQELKEAYVQHHEEIREYIARINKFQAQHDVQTQRISELERSQNTKPAKSQKGIAL